MRERIKSWVKKVFGVMPCDHSVCLSRYIDTGERRCLTQKNEQRAVARTEALKKLGAWRAAAREKAQKKRVLS